MSKYVNATHPPAVEIFEIGDPALANAELELLDQDLVQLQSVPMKARQVIIRLEDCAVLGYSTNLRVRTRPKAGEYIAFITFGPEAVGTINGLQVRSDIMVAAAPSSTIGVVAEPGYQSITIMIRPDALQAHLVVRDLEDRFPLPVEVETLHVGAEIAGELFEWGKSLISTATDNPDLFNTCAVQRAAAKADLVDTLLSTLSRTQKLEPERKERTKQIQSDIVRAAERYALAHTDDRLYVTDLCRAAGVSERTLEYAFRSVMGLRPTAYLSRIRLHRVHQALMMARPGSTTVTAEALNWGFWHFGEFSKAYKECFDELPSDTLKRASALTDKPNIK